jgi:ADP-ribose pyrophosphatase
MSTHYSKLVERKIKSKKIYKGVIGFNEDTVRLINGKTSTRAYTVHPGASAILPIADDGSIIFVEQYRYPIKTVTLELPAGKLKPRQTPLACAKAELAEETGYRAAKMTKLLDFCPSVAFSDEVLHIFIATGLTAGQTNPDDDEFVNTKKLSFEKALELVKKGKIRDSKTLIALLYYKTFCLK